jgi:hypothetical protein
MKTVQILVFVLASSFLISCGSETEKSGSNQVITDFLNDIHSLEKVENPIASFQEMAEQSANKVMSLETGNIKDIFQEAKSYSHCVIVTGNHTIVIIDDLENCKTSASWGECMPYAKGYIKKGELVYQEDYINNIIGRPDTQKRTVYLFD